MINNTINLSAIGYSKYNLSIDGRLYKTAPSPKEIKKDSINRFYIIADNGTAKKITLKELYRQAYNKELSIDKTADLPKEEWKPIEDTDGKYYISNYGRIKSLCGYAAKVL